MADEAADMVAARVRSFDLIRAYIRDDDPLVLEQITAICDGGYRDIGSTLLALLTFADSALDHIVGGDLATKLAVLVDIEARSVVVE